MLSFDEFDEIISSIKEKDRELSDISSALGGADRLYQISMCRETLELLKHIFQDKYDWIGYWMWELDFGEKWHKGCLTEADGTDIKLKSSEDLYRYLINNMQREDDD